MAGLEHEVMVHRYLYYIECAPIISANQAAAEIRPVEMPGTATED